MASKSFPQFPDLPTEIRFRIWRFAVLQMPLRIIHIQIYGGYELGAEGECLLDRLHIRPKSVWAPLPMMSATREARKICLEHYSLFYPNSLFDPSLRTMQGDGFQFLEVPVMVRPFYVDFTRDIFCLGNWMMESLERMSAQPLLQARLQRLAVLHSVWLALGHAKAQRLLAKLRALRQFIMVVEEQHNYGTCTTLAQVHSTAPGEWRREAWYRGEYDDDISLVRTVDPLPLKYSRKVWGRLLKQMPRNTREEQATVARVKNIQFLTLMIYEKERWELVMRMGELINWPPFQPNVQGDPRYQLLCYCDDDDDAEYLKQRTAAREEDIRIGKVKMNDSAAGFVARSLRDIWNRRNPGDFAHSSLGVWCMEDAATSRRKWEERNWRLEE